MIKKNSYNLIVYLVSFVLTWICFIYWFDKEAFDMEFREKETTSAIISNLIVAEVEESSHDSRRTVLQEVECVEYTYTVNGKKYKWDSATNGKNYSISDKIVIEYVTNNPANSRIKGQPKYSFNYFVRNSLPVGTISLIIMAFLLGFLDLFPKIRAIR